MQSVEQKSDDLGQAVGRMFLYLELLEDTLEGLRTGFAPPRLDTYLSRLAGLKSMAVFALESVEKSAVGNGVTATVLICPMCIGRWRFSTRSCALTRVLCACGLRTGSM